MSITDAVVCAALGAAAYHLYAKLRNLEAIVTSGVQLVSLGGEFDKAGEDHDNGEAGHKFGFTSNRR